MKRINRPELLDYDGASAYLRRKHGLNFSTRQLRRAVTARKVEHLRLGNVVRFAPNALDTFVAAAIVPVSVES